jgi:hypothetical protein
MEARGELPAGAADRLRHLFTESEEINARWRPVLERAVMRGEALSPAQREAYWSEAAGLREAMKDLPFHVRSQVENDDAMQFTPQGIPKWIDMQAGGSNAKTLQKVYGSAQAYYEEARARDLASPGRELVSRSEEAATRLGITFDPSTERFRAAMGDEPAHQALSEAIAADSVLSTRFAEAGGGPNAPAAERVAWFRKQPVDAEALIRLAQGNPQQG